MQSTLGRVTYSKGLAARRQHRSPKWPLNPIRTALKEKKKHETESLKAKMCFEWIKFSIVCPKYRRTSSLKWKNTASPGYVMVGYIAKHCTLWQGEQLTPNDEHPPWAPGGGTLDMEGPMPGAPLGNKPKAFRFKPGIRLDWSWSEERSFLLTQWASQDVHFTRHVKEFNKHHCWGWSTYTYSEHSEQSGLGKKTDSFC